MKKLNPSVVWAGHTAAGYATFFALSTWLPLGLHRIVMRRGRWWLFPVLFALFAAGALGFTRSGSPLWMALILPYVGLLVHDCLSLWTWEWPFAWTIRGKLRDLNAHYQLWQLVGGGAVIYALIWAAIWAGSAAGSAA
ncbi:hypothetical protein [Streptomyces cyaneofuscatus]|uniref:hypothetical protein n=1 Tax=Streptomyces cyaneofuscatus TaxID=66883 RepID=UPI002FF27750